MDKKKQPKRAMFDRLSSFSNDVQKRIVMTAATNVELSQVTSKPQLVASHNGTHESLCATCTSLAIAGANSDAVDIVNVLCEQDMIDALELHSAHIHIDLMGESVVRLVQTAGKSNQAVVVDILQVRKAIAQNPKNDTNNDWNFVVTLIVVVGFLDITTAFLRVVLSFLLNLFK